MPNHPNLISWLLEESSACIKLRVLTDLLGLPRDNPEVELARGQALETLPQARDLSWLGLKGQIITYNLTALAEAGLSGTDVPVDRVVDQELSQPFDVNCGQFMLMRALVMLGFSEDERLQARLAAMRDRQLPDGGWLCLHRLDKMKRIPKSCIKANMHALLLAGELEKHGMSPQWRSGVIEYFKRRRLFYRADNPSKLVLDCEPGYRMTDVHLPAEYLRVGLTYLMEALHALGQRNTPEFQDAWQLLKSKGDELGRVRLEGQLAKTYLPKERVGQFTRWGTLYTALALS